MTPCIAVVLNTRNPRTKEIKSITSVPTVSHTREAAFTETGVVTGLEAIITIVNE
jgi:hypothetical protein